MANTLTSLIPTLYESLDIVSREMVGFIPAVSHDASAERAALNQSILVPVAPATTTSSMTPAVTSPDTGDQTIGNVAMTISKSKYAPVRWNGEDTRGMLNAGTYRELLKNQFTQAIRAIVNEMETDLFTVAYQNASRASGTAGTTPFGTAGDLSDLALVRQILDNNGCPQSDLQCVVGSAAVAKLRGKQSLLLKLNESGSSALLRRGSITELPIEGFSMHNSAAVTQVTKGTGTSYVTSGSTAPGVGSIVLATGSGTVLAGDVVTFAADANNNYVVNSGVSAPGTITIGNPGAEVTIATANAMTIGGNYTPNMAFSKSAIQFISRVPAMPEGGDMAVDATIIVDPVSGLAFEVREYKQFAQNLYLVCAAWGKAAIKPNHIATMMG